ncbi:hypothetical protein F5B17DRAFT_397320 [Nemania serpens]|nr:hypothetical protein F5B17DRAFT_397320 [Nemania serpens]
MHLLTSKSRTLTPKASSGGRMARTSTLESSPALSHGPSPLLRQLESHLVVSGRDTCHRDRSLASVHNPYSGNAAEASNLSWAVSDQRTNQPTNVASAHRRSRSTQIQETPTGSMIPTYHAANADDESPRLEAARATRRPRSQSSLQRISRMRSFSLKFRPRNDPAARLGKRTPPAPSETLLLLDKRDDDIVVLNGRHPRTDA